MMSGWWFAAVLAAGTLSSSPQPPAPDEKLAAMGVGMAPCGKFTEIDARDPKWTRDTFQSWAEGFMAGANGERGQHKQPSVIVNATSKDEQWANLEAFCSAHPDKPFALGVMILYLGLPTKEHAP